LFEFRRRVVAGLAFAVVALEGEAAVIVSDDAAVRRLLGLEGGISCSPSMAFFLPRGISAEGNNALEFRQPILDGNRDESQIEAPLVVRRLNLVRFGNCATEQRSVREWARDSNGDHQRHLACPEKVDLYINLFNSSRSHLEVINQKILIKLP
jgi:hypothetical protein